MEGKERDLIEPEGVNAGSARSTAEGPRHAGDVTHGGHPERADDQAGRHDDDQIVDVPFMPTDPGAPSLEQSSEEGAR